MIWLKPFEAPCQQVSADGQLQEGHQRQCCLLPMNHPKTALNTTNVPSLQLEQDGDVLEQRWGMGSVVAVMKRGDEIRRDPTNRRPSQGACSSNSATYPPLVGGVNQRRRVEFSPSNHLKKGLGIQISNPIDILGYIEDSCGFVSALTVEPSVGFGRPMDVPNLRQST